MVSVGALVQFVNSADELDRPPFPVVLFCFCFVFSFLFFILVNINEGIC